MRSLLLCLLVVLLLGPARAAEPFFKKGDVIALVGGEDMVVASEYGYLELLLTRALPDYKLRFRNLAWEGDTVFEQRRDLNFPTYEEQLDKIGATVVIAQFGQMESLAGKEKLPEFIAAYEKLIERFSGGGKRRVCIVEPFGVIGAWENENSGVSESLLERFKDFTAYLEAIHTMMARRSLPDESLSKQKLLNVWTCLIPPTKAQRVLGRDGIHLSIDGHSSLAQGIAGLTDVPFQGMLYTKGVDTLRQLIIAKNKLWFDYWRPQNWAFLAGDRTAQPSSRDHLDPSKRWFPPEREAFLPLLEAKEKEIDALAAQLAQGR